MIGEELTVLLVAEGERLAPALRERLAMHGIGVFDCTAAKVVDTAFVVAPDLVVLAGDAAEEGGIDVLAALAARPATASLPIVLVSDHARDASSFRHGVVAVVERTASADELARRIAEVARELPERTGEARGALDEGSVGALVELLAESLRTGILTVTGPGGVSARVVLRADRPATEVIEQIVERLRPLSGETGQLRYEFHETPTGRLGALDLDVDDDALALSQLSRDRILMIEQNPARADLLAQGLRAYGARVAVADGLGRGLELAREMSPDVVIVDSSAMDGWAVEALRKIRRDPWLRWGSLLLVDAARLWRDERRPDIAMLAASVEALLRGDRDLGERAASEMTFGTRLEVIGPVRMLRALVETRLGLRVRVIHPRVIVDIDLADGLVAGASARLPQGSAPAVDGPAALATLFAISSGRVQIERADAPRNANVMSPLDDALAAAAREEPAVGASIPPPSSLSLDAPPEMDPRLPREVGEVAGIVGHLEQLLDELRAHTRASLAPSSARVIEASDAGVAPSLAAPARAPLVPRPEPEESTSVVDAVEVAQLRRRMRQSSQRLRAIRVPQPKAASSQEGLAADAVAVAGLVPSAIGTGLAPPRASRKQTLVFAPVQRRPSDVPPVLERSSGRAISSAHATSPGIAAPPDHAALRGRAAPPDRALSPAETATAAPAPPAPKVPLPFPAKRLGAPSSKRLPQVPPPRPPPAPSSPDVALAEPTRSRDVDVDVELAAPSDPQPAAPLASLATPPVLATSAPVAAIQRPRHPTPRAALSDGSRSASSVPDASRSASPVPGASRSASVLPSTATTPVLGIAPVVLPSSRRPRLALIAAIGVLAVVAVLTIGVTLAWVGGSSELVAEPVAFEPTEQSAQTAQPAGTPSPADPIARPPAEHVATTPPPTSFGPSADAPLDGEDADLDITTILIAPARPPVGRRQEFALVRGLLREATTARRHDELDVASTAYRQVLGVEPTNGRATAGLAYVHLEREELPQALLWAQRLVRLRPEHASHWVLLGDVLRRGGNVEGARRSYARGLSVQPTWTTAQRRLDELSAAL